jgi:lipopolysaccharide transport system ATP-binding protein
MGRTIINIENLSKRYLISRARQNGAVNYPTLRDEIAVRAKSALKTLLFFWKGSHFNKRGQDPFVRQTIKEDIWVLKDISFKIQKGERVGIIGRNGAGKTTLLKVLSRITQPTNGTINIRGRVASLLEVGTGFHPELTGRENIYLNGAILGMKRAEIRKQFDEIVAFAEVEKFLDTPVKRYSSGMYVRLAFSVAAHLEPEILLVDEVLAVGDAAFQKKCLGKMEDIGNLGKTVLFVSHNMLMVEHLCSRAVLLEDGVVKQDGPAKKVVGNYLESFSDDSLSKPLHKRSDRTGTGEYRFSSIRFTDANGKAVNAFMTGETVNVHALLQPNGQTIKISPVANLCIRDRSGFRLFTLASGLKNIKLTLDGPTEIHWKIEKLPLLEDAYRCDLYLASSIGGVGIIDYVLDAFILHVLPTDYMGTGRSQVQGLDKILVDYQMDWKKS